jgi:hypothetical protein
VRVSDHTILRGVHPDAVKAIEERPCKECGRADAHVIEHVTQLHVFSRMWVTVHCDRCRTVEVWTVPY